MALEYWDRVQDTTATTGTGTITVDDAPPTGFRGFGTVTNGAQCKVLVDDGAGNWEIFESTWDSSARTLTRDRLIASSTGSAISFGVGSKDVVLVATSEDVRSDKITSGTSDITVTASTAEVTVASTLVMTASATGVYVSGTAQVGGIFHVAAGSAAAAGVGVGEADTGFFLVSTGVGGATANGSSVFQWGPGFWTNGATGGNQGANSVNASSYYVDGTRRDIVLISPTSLSGTTVDLTGIRAGARRITLLVLNASLSGTDEYELLLGDSGGFETTGYSGNMVVQAGGGSGLTAWSTAAVLTGLSAAADVYNGKITLLHGGSNQWFIDSELNNGSDAINHAGGDKTLTGELTQLRFQASGTDTFDAGTIVGLVE